MKLHERLTRRKEKEAPRQGSHELGSAATDRVMLLDLSQERGPSEKVRAWQREHGVAYAPAYDNPGLRDMTEERRETLVGWHEEGVRNAHDYLQGMFPDKQFELISDEGSSAVVFGDDDFAYKVMRTPDGYSYYEGEMATMQKLYELDLAPQPVALIDAARDEQIEGESVLHNDKFGDMNIPRVQGNGALPVIVMERVKAPVSPSEAPWQDMKQLPDAIRDMIKHGVALGDCELSYDQASGKFTVLDCGGASDIRKMNSQRRDRMVTSMLSMLCRLDLRLNVNLPHDATSHDWLRVLDNYVASLSERGSMPSSS